MINFSEKNVKAAMYLLAKKMADEFPTDTEVAYIGFSAEFEQKLNRIIRQSKNKLFSFFNTTAKRVASVVIVCLILLSATFSVSAIRVPFIKMLRKAFENYVEINFEGDTKDCISEVYGLTYIPEGFKLTNEMVNLAAVNREYANEAGAVFDYSQSPTTFSAGIVVDNEHSTHYTITADGLEIYVVNSERNTNSVFWAENGYSFLINFFDCDISDDEIISMVKSNAMIEYYTE
ncbi:MAG: DUF4367 domain-containing protein [Clostridia bacterium]|nr:DUF4367 domain-containing protein [Clostridia bacterium]